MQLKKYSLILFICILCVLNSSYAQKGTIHYIHTVNNGPMSSNVINYQLVFSGGKSLEIPLKKNRKESESVKIIESESIQFVKTGSRVPFVYKDFVNQNLYVSDNIGFDYHLISDTLNTFDWIITDKEKVIQNFICKQALVNYRGRNYIAWFTEDIPLPFGPWKFGGLPGLIIKLYDTDEKYFYELSGIDLKTEFDENIIKVPSSYSSDSYLSHKEFMKLHDTKIKELRAKSRIVSYGDNYSKSSSIVLSEKKELF